MGESEVSRKSTLFQEGRKRGILLANSASRSEPFLLKPVLREGKSDAVKQMMYFHIPFFSVLFFFQGCIYSLLEICKPITNSDIALFIVRVLGFGVFAVSMPSVYENYLSYLQFKPCHTHVSPSTAIKEYICLCVIVLFSLSQVRDYNPLMMNLTALRYDTIPSNDRADYSPDFMTSRFDSAPFASMRTWKVSSTI